MSELDKALIHHQPKEMVKVLIADLLIEAYEAVTREDHEALAKKVEAL